MKWFLIFLLSWAFVVLVLLSLNSTAQTKQPKQPTRAELKTQISWLETDVEFWQGAQNECITQSNIALAQSMKDLEDAGSRELALVKENQTLKQQLADMRALVLALANQPAPKPVTVPVMVPYVPDIPAPVVHVNVQPPPVNVWEPTPSTFQICDTHRTSTTSSLTTCF